MTDKELLEKAAKAAGINGYADCDHIGCFFCKPDNFNPAIYRWSTDEADAFRLAADVGLLVDFYHDRVISGSLYGRGHRDWLYADDCDGSMCLAITRAAAAMAND